MPASITIREAGIDDAPIIVRQRRVMFEDMGGTDPGRLDIMDRLFAPYLARQLAQGGYRGWLAQTDEGRVVAGGGLIVPEWVPSPRDRVPRSCHAYILNIYTEPAYRGQGLARRIMETILAWCRAEGLGTVSLHASPMGRSLYESLGFQPTNEMRIRLD